jgi:hypothetical protein
MFPCMLTDHIRVAIDRYRDVALGWKRSGAGGGGYLVLVAYTPVENAMRIKIRRKSAAGRAPQEERGLALDVKVIRSRLDRRCP